MDLQVLHTVSQSHRVALIEGGYPVADTEPMPHYYLIVCSCGYEGRSYHGHDHAKEIAQRHIFVQVMEIEKGLTPGGANR